MLLVAGYWLLVARSIAKLPLPENQIRLVKGIGGVDKEGAVAEADGVHREGNVRRNAVDGHVNGVAGLATAGVGSPQAVGAGSIDHEEAVCGAGIPKEGIGLVGPHNQTNLISGAEGGIGAEGGLNGEAVGQDTESIGDKATKAICGFQDYFGRSSLVMTG